MEITPPQAHMALESLVRAGFPPMSTVGLPGTHGPGMTGMQGMGVNTPIAAAVAAATVGFAIEVQVAKGGMFTIGIWSKTEARAWLDMTLAAGSTLRTEGAAPKVHCMAAPPHTQKDIVSPLF